MASPVPESHLLGAGADAIFLETRGEVFQYSFIDEGKFSPDNPPEVHWDCPKCGWVDDTV
ncbi:MAG TPA: hypothetical protein V6D48_10670 [Oculatellaceae cyanobacterium]